jgi:hypothetical protein
MSKVLSSLISQAGCRAVAVATVLAWTMAGPVQAEPTTVEPFGKTTWVALQRQLSRPAVVVFSATDCSHCPATIAAIDAERRRLFSAPLPPLVVVVMDVQSSSEAGTALLKDVHYAQADRLMVFEDQPAALRYTIDPRWLGVTPFVAMLIPGRAAPEMTMGTPSEEDFKRLYGAARSPALAH